MTSILGISAFYHDSAATLIKDGEIISAVQEERFSRKKHDARYPFNAVKYILNENKITLKIQQLEKKLSLMEQRSEEVQKDMKILESEIEDARKQVEPQFLSHYDRTKTVISKPPYMAPVEDQRCNGCNLRVSNDVVSSILVERKITQCDQCGRIVYAER